MRRNGPAYLRAMSISDIRSLLSGFLTNNFYDIGTETFTAQFTDSYAAHVSDNAKNKLTAALEKSAIFAPVNDTHLFPLVTITADAGFTAPSFFFAAPNNALLGELPAVSQKWIDPAFYPPLVDTQAKKEIPAAWLGVRAPNNEAAQKLKAAILGAAALTLSDRYRYMFSGRHMFGGVCAIGNYVSFNFGKAHTPALTENLRIRGCDQAWLEILAGKITSNETADQRQLRALEYFYRAWGLPVHERFPLHCMALEAIYSQKGKTTQSVKDGIRATLGPHISEIRIGDLLSLRGAVIHGHAPDVYDAEEYDDYYNNYSADPVSDLALLTAAALRRHLFAGVMQEQVEPYKDIIAKAQAEGQMPKKLGGHSILDAPAPTQPPAP